MATLSPRQSKPACRSAPYIPFPHAWLQSWRWHPWESCEPIALCDPMAGSGTVLRQALALGHRAIGFDMDPLAVLMSRVWTSPIDETALDLELKAVMKAAATVDLRSHSLHWHDEETRAFVKDRKSTRLNSSN